MSDVRPESTPLQFLVIFFLGIHSTSKEMKIFHKIPMRFKNFLDSIVHLPACLIWLHDLIWPCCAFCRPVGKLLHFRFQHEIFTHFPLWKNKLWVLVLTNKNRTERILSYASGPSINYVVSKSAIFDPLSLCRLFTKSNRQFLTQPLPRRHSLWTAPSMSGEWWHKKLIFACWYFLLIIYDSCTSSSTYPKYMFVVFKMWPNWWKPLTLSKAYKNY